MREALDASGVRVYAGSAGVPSRPGRLHISPGEPTTPCRPHRHLAAARGTKRSGRPLRSGRLHPHRRPRAASLGMRDVFAAGDATAFPIKQGGLAAQQADAVAEAIAASAGAGVASAALPAGPARTSRRRAGRRATCARALPPARAMTAPSPSGRCGGRRTGSAAATSRPISAAGAAAAPPCSQDEHAIAAAVALESVTTDGRRVLSELADLSPR